VHVSYHGKFSGIMVTRHSVAKNYILEFRYMLMWFFKFNAWFQINMHQVVLIFYVSQNVFYHA